MKTDRELLEMAAKAAGYRWLRSVGGKSWTVRETRRLATGEFYDLATDLDRAAAMEENK